MATPVVASNILQLGVRAQIFDKIRSRTVPSLHMCFPIGKNDQVRVMLDRLVAVPDGPGPIEEVRLENLITGTGEDQVSGGMKIAAAVGAEFGGLLAARASAYPVAFHVETYFAEETIGVVAVSTLKIWRMRAPRADEV